MTQVVRSQPVSFWIRTVASVVISVVAVGVHAGFANSSVNLALLAIVRIATDAVIDPVVIKIVRTSYNVLAIVVGIKELAVNAGALLLWIY